MATSFVGIKHRPILRRYARPIALIAALATITGFVIVVTPAIGDWFRWRIPVDDVPAKELTILISQFRSDPDGRVTSEIEARLLRHGWESIRFRRTLTTEQLIEHSRDRNLSASQMARVLFERHGGEVLITGDVSATSNRVRVKVFERALERAPAEVELDLTIPWMGTLAPHVEGAILHSLVRAESALRSENHPEFTVRAVPIESKAIQLAETASIEAIKDEAHAIHEQMTARIGVVAGDATRLNAAREDAERRLTREGPFDSTEDEVAALWAVADLSRIEALQIGDRQLLDRSFTLSRAIRRLLQVPEEDPAYPSDFLRNPLLNDVLEMESSVALACADRHRIDELLEIYARVASCHTDRLDISCPDWASRGIFALRYSRVAWSARDLPPLYAAASVVDYWANIVGYGGQTGHWSDPMVHADRLLRSRLPAHDGLRIPFAPHSTHSPATPETDTQSPPPRFKTGSCPNLIRLSALPPATDTGPAAEAPAPAPARGT